MCPKLHEGLVLLMVKMPKESWPDQVQWRWRAEF
jgi:hypothetical protein